MCEYLWIYVNITVIYVWIYVHTITVFIFEQEIWTVIVCDSYHPTGALPDTVRELAVVSSSLGWCQVGVSLCQGHAPLRSSEHVVVWHTCTVSIRPVSTPVQHAYDPAAGHGSSTLRPTQSHQARDMMSVGTHGHGLGWLSLLSDFKYPVLSSSTLRFSTLAGPATVKRSLRLGSKT